MVTTNLQNSLEQWALDYEKNSMADGELSKIKDLIADMGGLNKLATAIDDMQPDQQRFFFWCLIMLKSDKMKVLYFLGKVDRNANKGMAPIWNLLALGIMPVTKDKYAKYLGEQKRKGWVNHLEEILNANAEIRQFVDHDDYAYCRGWFKSVAHLQTVHTFMNDLHLGTAAQILPFDFERTGKEGIKAFLNQRVQQINSSTSDQKDVDIATALTSLSPAFYNTCLENDYLVHNEIKLSSALHNKKKAM